MSHSPKEHTQVLADTHAEAVTEQHLLVFDATKLFFAVQRSLQGASSVKTSSPTDLYGILGFA